MRCSLKINEKRPFFFFFIVIIAYVKVPPYFLSSKFKSSYIV